jgi:dTDP-4-amino-4,6-dideoxygalactose transaminase
MRELAGRDDQLRDRRQITSRMDEVQAAVLRVKLKYLPTWIEERREIAAQYGTLLPPWVKPVAGSNDLHHLFVVRVEQRNQLRTFLSETGVETKIHFPEPLHRQHGPWTNPSRPLPIAEQWCRLILTLPCFPGLSRAEIKYITALIARFFDHSSNRSLPKFETSISS